MTHLSRQQVQQIQDALAQREAQLQAEVRTMRETGAAPPSSLNLDVRDPVDDGDARFMAGLDHVQLLRDQEELRDISQARERMRQGDYGRCEACDEPIPYERLRTQPAARFCIVHQEEWERGHPAVPPFTA